MFNITSKEHRVFLQTHILFNFKKTQLFLRTYNETF